MHWLKFLLVFALLSLAQAAYVYGDIYQPNLERMNRTVVRVDGPFSYQLVTDKANYSIFLPEGDYTLSAMVLDASGNTAFHTEEIIKVGTNDQRVDLVLKPVINLNFILFCAFGLLLVFAISKFMIFQNKKQTTEPTQPVQVQTSKTKLDGDAKSVLTALDSFEGRANQKDLKEATHFSDAKLSLILTELEQTGYVKRFKKGRGNIIKKL